MNKINNKDDNLIFEKYEEMPINKCKSLVTSLKVDIDNNVVVGVDVRYYKLYAKHGVMDGKLKPSDKGLSIDVKCLEFLIRSLIKIYENVSNKKFVVE